MDSILDHATSGPLHLRRSEIAILMIDAIRHGEEHTGYYRSHAYVVMANHVHRLITPLVEVSKITHALKRFTARSANQLLGLTGQPFWQDESYDHLGRDGEEFDRIVHYIRNNPVKAGLAAQLEDFPWSSASLRVGEAD